ncbi:MAG: metallopeptidase TldD-related protein, partial [Acidobacteriota bacterium]|nr:metallopeptidase TldD-related protein [Acidobacteriota bacterium]
GHGSRRLESPERIDSRLQRIAVLAHALAGAEATMSDGVQSVLLHPHVVQSYVLSTLLFNLRGSVVSHGEGQFALDRFGAEDAVLRDDIHLRFDPLHPFRSGTYRFTAEGIAAERCSFIDRGRLVQPILDLKFAHRLQMTPTPQITDSDSIEFGDGKPLDEEQAGAETAGGPLVLSVLGVHTQDSSSGDFSLSAPHVLALGADGYSGRGRGTLSGNLFDILRDPETRFVRFEGESVPGMRVRCRFDPR